MEYTVNKLARISGISTRTLRYYDDIGLLIPKRCSNGYRIYGAAQIDMLQQILFYRELGVGLDEIKIIINSPSFNREKALLNHLDALKAKKEQLETLIKNVSKTLESIKGDEVMKDTEKFEGFKKKLIEENEEKYGKEVRSKYGEDTVNNSNKRLAGMTKEQWQKQEDLSKEIFKTLDAAMKEGNPEGELARKVCELHREWLCMFWGDGAYSKEAHMNMGEMYVCDERFRDYYDKNAGKGATLFLRDALKVYTK